MSARPTMPRLVSDWDAGYIKFNGREPRTLEELAIARADCEHKRRLAEVKAMRAKLALLAEFLPALTARGIKLADRDIRTWDGGKTLRIPPQMFSRDNKLCDALIALGFKEVERNDSFRDEQQVTLKHGRSLVLIIDVTKPQAAEAKATGDQP